MYNTRICVNIKVYEKVKEDRERQNALLKFSSELKLKDKLDNVERVGRMTEFRRLQTMQRIMQQDARYEEIQSLKEGILRKHAEECKNSLIRKHEIGDTMERMRLTNDYSLLDKLFVDRRNNNRRAGTSGGNGSSSNNNNNSSGNNNNNNHHHNKTGRTAGGEDGEDRDDNNRLNQTI